MDKYFICMLVVMGCMCVHLLIIGLTINTIRDYVKMITKELIHKDILKEELQNLIDDGK